ncbi:serine/threonine protein kinase [bacterium]|nr:serine/threonine protein kinase [bacterium]
MIGTEIGKYKILSEAGFGGMARVFLAEDTQLKRKVALKLLHEHLVSNQEHIQRFEREALTLAKLKHPNIVQVHEYQSENNRHFIVNEFVDGVSLKEFLLKQPQKYPLISLMIMTQILGAISHAHENGVIHRDIKPENIMISKEGEIKVMDFGISHLITESTLTMTGSILGSPAYMSPEQAQGLNVDFSSDVFSLGTLFYLLLTNRPPFGGNNPSIIIKNVIDVNYENPMRFNPLIDKEIVRVLESSLNKKRDLRFKNASTFFEATEAILKKEGILSFSNELKDYFKNPQEYEKKFHQRLSTRYTLLAKQCYKRRELLKSLNYTTKALELSPKNKDLQIIARKLKLIQTTNHFWSFFLFLLFFVIFFTYSFIKAIKIDEYGSILSLGKASQISMLMKNSLNFISSEIKKGGEVTLLYDTTPIFENSDFDTKIDNSIEKIKDDSLKSKKIDKNSVLKIDNKRQNSNKIDENNTTTKNEESIDKNIIEENRIIDENIKKKDFVAIKEVKNGEFLFCFRPYADVYINNELQTADCIASPIKLPYGKHTIAAIYPFANRYSKNFTIGDSNPKLEIRHNFSIYNTIYFEVKTGENIDISLKTEDKESVIALNKNKKKVELVQIKSNKNSFYFIQPGIYTIEANDGDLYIEKNIDLRKKGSYRIIIDLTENREVRVINF